MNATGTIHPSGDERSRERRPSEKEFAKPAIRRILVPIDWSEPSKCAFPWAASLAQQNGAELIVLYVVPLPTVMYGPAPDNYLKHMHEELDRINPADPTTRIKHLLAEGDPATAIV